MVTRTFAELDIDDALNDIIQSGETSVAKLAEGFGVSVNEMCENLCSAGYILQENCQGHFFVIGANRTSWSKYKKIKPSLFKQGKYLMR